MSKETLAGRMREIADEFPLESSRRIQRALADEVEALDELHKWCRKFRKHLPAGVEEHLAALEATETT